MHVHRESKDSTSEPRRTPREPSRGGQLRFLDLVWRWDWLEGDDPDVYSRMTMPAAHCPDCGRGLRVAPTASRAVPRPSWPALFSCRACGFLRGFPEPPEDLVARVYRRVNRLFGAGPGPADFREAV